MYKEVDLLHRDISMGNLAFYKDGDKYIVVLLDFDYAVFASSAENATQRLTGKVVGEWRMIRLGGIAE